jgi:phage baseplate assembly protein W
MINKITKRDFLGRGLIAPLRRLGAADFVSSDGPELVRSALRQIVGTRRGEVRWRPTFGLLVDRSRHKLENDDLDALLRTDIETAVRQFEPRIDSLNITVKFTDTQTVVRIDWNIIAKNIPGNQVILGPDSVEVTI